MGKYEKIGVIYDASPMDRKREKSPKFDETQIERWFAQWFVCPRLTQF